MSLIDRVQSILLRPKQTWPVIAAESADTASLYSNYIAILAAIPAIAVFIGLSVIGFGGLISYRVPILTGLVQMVVSYVMSLVVVYVLALIVDALAPTFGGSKSQIQALKLVAYSCTAAFVGGIFNLIPSLGIIGLLFGIYSIYLLYTGMSPLMRCPPEKAGPYTAVVVVCGIVVGAVLGAVMFAFMPSRMGPAGMVVGASGRPAGNITIQSPDGATVTINGDSMAEMAKRMEAASQKAKAAQSSGDPAAAGTAVGEMMAAMTGGNAKPIASADLKAMLPESIAGMQQKSMESSSNQAMGLAVSTAKASYSDGEHSVNFSITDTGGLAGLAAVAGWANVVMDKDSDGKIEKIYKDGSRTVHEEYNKDGSRSEMTVILANGVIVESEGSSVDMATVKKVLAGVDLAKIEALKRAAK